MINQLSKIPINQSSLLFLEPLKKYTWFKVGGNAEVLFTPQDITELKTFLIHCPKTIPITTIGAGSNLLIRDGGIEGVVISTRKLKKISCYNNIVTAQSGVLDMEVARNTAKNSIKGFEFLIGIPGSIGGAIKMNAGSYGRELKDILVEVEALDRNGIFHYLNSSELKMNYRQTNLPNDWIVVSAKLIGKKGSQAKIKSKMKEIIQNRVISQPQGVLTGGSTFKNPQGMKTWELIDKAGCRGLKFGGASVSEKHCNFLINHGSATASDIENLGELVREKVINFCGVKLYWEIHRVGKNLLNIEGRCET